MFHLLSGIFLASLKGITGKLCVCVCVFVFHYQCFHPKQKFSLFVSHQLGDDDFLEDAGSLWISISWESLKD
jgi:hypothetical protein